MIFNNLIPGPTGNGSYVAPNSPTGFGVTGVAGGNPAPNAQVAATPVGSNVLNLTWPIPAFVMPQNAIKGAPGEPPAPFGVIG